MNRAFWPGFNWRVLAHKRNKNNSRGIHTGDTWQTYSGERWSKPPPWLPDRVYEPFLEGHWEFDEVVIDDWLHLEQMDDRDWWMSLGNGDNEYHVWINIDRDGKASVSFHKQ